MRALGVALVVLAAVSEARTIRGVLGDAQELVGIRPHPAFSAFAAHVVTLAADLTGSQSLTSVVHAVQGATIDSSMSLLGPIFLDHAETLGAGVTNLNVVGQRGLADASLFGQPFSELGAGVPPGVTVLQRTATADPNSPALTGVRLQYHLDLHLWAAAIAVSHGLTDALDVSLVVPILSTRLDCTVSADAVRAINASGAFVRVPETHRQGTARPVQSTGIGDLVLRLKYKLPPVLAPVEAAITLEGQFPTGDVDQIHGTADYWLLPGMDLRLPVWGTRAELAVHGGIDFDVSDSVRSQAEYGVAASVMLWPKRLAGIVEFLGRSQLDSIFTPHDTEVLTYTGGAFVPANLLGIDFARRVDAFDFAFGLRAIITPGIVLFASGALPLNRDALLRADGVIPTIGIGGTF